MGVADLEGVGERGRQRDRRRRGRWTRVKAQVVVRCHGSLQSQETDAGQPWEAGGTAKRAVSHTGSGRGLSPMMCSLTPETNLTNGHTAPMRGRSRRPTVSKAEEHRAPGAAPVPSTCEAAQPPRPLTSACSRLPEASAALRLPAAADAQRSAEHNLSWRCRDMRPKPKQFATQYASIFGDASVVSAYQYRPPYPSETFELLLSLLDADA